MNVFFALFSYFWYYNLPDLMVCVLVTIAVTKHHDWDNLRKKEFMGAYSFRGWVMIIILGHAAGMAQEQWLRDYILGREPWGRGRDLTRNCVGLWRPKAYPSDVSPARPHPLILWSRSTSWGEAFSYMSLWRPFSFKPPCDIHIQTWAHGKYGS